MVKPLLQKELDRREAIHRAIDDFYGFKLTPKAHNDLYIQLVKGFCTDSICAAIKRNLPDYVQG